jgi:hypothetical protein
MIVIKRYYLKDGELAVVNKCHDCPINMGYIEVGLCPNCRAKKLFMSINTHVAACEACGATYGIPMAVKGICYDDKRCKRYTISIDSKLNKEQLLVFSELIGMNAAAAYRLFKNNSPVVVEKVPMVATYQSQRYFSSVGLEIKIDPTIDEYPLFKECWNI